MSNEQRQTKDKLVLLTNLALAKKKSELVKRGLELIIQHEFRGQQVHVLIGNLENSITEVICRCIDEVARSKCNLRVISTGYAQELLELARSHEVDIFIFVLNNIGLPSPSENYPPENRIEKVLEIITHIRTVYRRPVIAFAGWPDDPSLAEKARLAGASFFYRLPFSVKDFQEVFSRLLSMVFEGRRYV